MYNVHIYVTYLGYFTLLQFRNLDLSVLLRLSIFSKYACTSGVYLDFILSGPIQCFQRPRRKKASQKKYYVILHCYGNLEESKNFEAIIFNIFQCAEI